MKSEMAATSPSEAKPYLNQSESSVDTPNEICAAERIVQIKN